MLSALHPELISSFKHLPSTAPVAFFTRHSIREEAQNGFASYDVPLTKEGVELAIALGGELQKPIHRAFSSPVQRCVDTAQGLLDGANSKLQIEQSTLLVEPGSYVQDIEKVGGLFFKLGPLKFANKHLRGEVRGVLSPVEGTKRLLEHLQKGMGESGTLSIHVTHDTILAAFMYSLLGVSEIDDSHWPWMMEGAFVWFDNDIVHCVWRGQKHQIDMKDLI